MSAMLSRPDTDVLSSKKRKEAAKACEMCKSEALTRPPLLALRAPKVILPAIALRCASRLNDPERVSRLNNLRSAPIIIKKAISRSEEPRTRLQESRTNGIWNLVLGNWFFPPGQGASPCKSE